MQTSAPLSTLLLIFLWILSVLASPLPPIDDSTQVSRSYRRADSQAPDAHAKPKYQVKLEIAIALKNTVKEHSFLVIGNTIIHAEWYTNTESSNSQVIQTGNRRDKSEKKRWHWISIGEASFNDKEDEENIIKSALAIEMPPYEHNGNCRDFIKMVL
ncbi:hypothetical protein GGU11DRAFT_759154, partial [Lentinula aff. detonsa]